MNAGIDKVVFNYIQYVLLDINLAFILVYFLCFIQLKFYFELSQNKCLFWLYFIFQRHGHPQKLNLGRKLAHYSLWFTIVCGGKPVFVPDWILCKNGKLNRWILLQGFFFPFIFLVYQEPYWSPMLILKGHYTSYPSIQGVDGYVSDQKYKSKLVSSD